MTPTHPTKKAKRYRYYVSASFLAEDRLQARKGMRIPAGDIEGLVLDRLRAFFSSRTEISDALAPLDLDAQTLDAALRNIQAFRAMVRRVTRRDEEPRPGHCRAGDCGGRSDRNPVEPRENRRDPGGGRSEPMG